MNTQTLPSTIERDAAAESTRYLIGDYERNGYNDSDFFAIYWDSSANTIDEFEIGSTRYAGHDAAIRELQALKQDVPDHVARTIVTYLHQVAHAALLSAELRRVNEPGPGELAFATSVVIQVDSPKRVQTPYRAGERGEIFWTGHFGQFYRNGYKIRSRENGRAGVRTTDGRKVYCPMSALRLDRDPNLASVEAEARHAASILEFRHCLPRYTWATRTNAVLADTARALYGVPRSS